MSAPAGSAHRSLVRGPALWWSVVAVGGAVFALRLAYFYFHDVADGEAGTFGVRLFEEATAVLVGGLLVAGVVRLAQRVPLTRARWPRTLLVYGGAFVAFTTLHTVGMVALRAALAPTVGFDHRLDLTRARFLYEGANDVLLYAGVLTALALAEHLLARRERERREAALERSLLEAQLQSLRLQLQPHFLFNALNTIASVMYDDPAAADALLGHLAELLRASLRSTHAQTVPLREELLLLEQYAALLRARFGERFALHVEVEPELLTAAVPSMLLQPLLENAVRHGGLERTGHGVVTLTIRAAVLPDGAPGLALRVHDDGPGLAAGVDPLRSGTGLSATAQRLRLLYGDRQALAAADAPEGGFAVALRLPHEVHAGEPAAAPPDATPPRPAPPTPAGAA